jgi:hypothetical protein
MILLECIFCFILCANICFVIIEICIFIQSNYIGLPKLKGRDIRDEQECAARPQVARIGDSH